ncbi:MAG: hypothetical protein RL108_166 [Bacteroidota bacterium]|jgi:hypothetical protein
MNHPLKCPNCSDYRYIEFEGVRFEDPKAKKGFDVKIPFFVCKTCGKRESILPLDRFLNFRDEMLPSIHEGEFFDMPLKYIFSKLDSEKRFKHFDHLDFQYDPRDNYIIPGLYREWDDGYLTPVFFDKDLLLYYNGHPDYTVKFTSFSSCNIYFKGESMFEWGFGINRYGKLFKWLGDLDKDFKDESMKSHLKRFQASNTPSEHEIVSKFYLSQNPFSPSDAFQSSDNEIRLFSLKNDFNKEIREKFGVELTKFDIVQLAEYFKPPILEEREQIFSAFLSLNKYFIENLHEQSLREILLKSGLKEEELQKEGKKLGTLKLFNLFIKYGLKKENAENMVSPLYVLNDLRQLHGHLSDTSFEKRYNSCKERLAIPLTSTDLDVFKTLVTSIILLYQSLIDKKDD